MKYPTRGGILVPPVELGFHDPTPEEIATRRLTTVHHGWWERYKYDTRHRVVFRNLIDHAFDLLAVEHPLLHELYDAPKRPHDALMIEVLENYLMTHGVIRCIKEKRTKEVYEIQPEEFEHIKKGYKNGTSH